MTDAYLKNDGSNINEFIEWHKIHKAMGFIDPIADLLELLGCDDRASEDENALDEVTE